MAAAHHPPLTGEDPANYVAEVAEVTDGLKSELAGKIKNGGSQVVKAPSQTTDPKKGTVQKGNDLRTGKK